MNTECKDIGRIRIPLRYRFYDWLNITVRCWLFHRRFYEYQTYGGTWKGRDFHHAQVCTLCDEIWPEYLPPQEPR